LGLGCKGSGFGVYNLVKGGPGFILFDPKPLTLNPKRYNLDPDG